MRHLLLACGLGMVSFIVGCQTTVLTRATTDQALSATDVNYQQVLDNLAMLAADPQLLPYFAAPGTGTDSIQRTYTGTYVLNWDLITTGVATYIGRYLFDKQNATVAASQLTQEAWATATTLDPEKLKLMQFVYLRTLGDSSDDSERNLIKFFGEDSHYLSDIHSGWVAVGCKHDVPKKACYVGHYCKTYVWVDHTELESLSKLTLAILDIATAASPVGQADPLEAEIKSLREKAKDLSDILSKNILDKDKPASRELVNQLRDAVTQLDIRMITKELRDPKITNDHRDELTARLNRLDSPIAQNTKQAIYGTTQQLTPEDARKKAIDQYPPTSPLSPRPRLNLYSPYPVPITAQVP